MAADVSRTSASAMRPLAAVLGVAAIATAAAFWLPLGVQSDPVTWRGAAFTLPKEAILAMCALLAACLASSTSPRDRIEAALLGYFACGALSVALHGAPWGFAGAWIVAELAAALVFVAGREPKEITRRKKGNDLAPSARFVDAAHGRPGKHMRMSMPSSLYESICKLASA